ncbi:PAS domain-containing sensor histidine kinase [Aestuariirhabdus sp. Z084]|uniref:PAS domain-containing sensor histidine kinase n=1 Tax=Aestuariirhabdus haliotis TaxID=2918751 RepID=UPI00201B44A3|nr:PAS domain-containing sensor histidine kinase [Aestuariirhabdus haliotis]MCL6415510.1 PAS domain-containing sensor histidine kinase [Aestuariirhabdus haliotis]MCL6419285.1 PAS domain-containing sensor histidine kinase [Aestuariirhabdus haliotis]
MIKFHLYSVLGFFTTLVMLLVGLMSIYPDYRVASSVIEYQQQEYAKTVTRLSNLTIENAIDKVSSNVELLTGKIEHMLEMNRQLTADQMWQSIHNVFDDNEIDHSEVVFFIPVDREKAIYTQESDPLYQQLFSEIRASMPVSGPVYFAKADGRLEGVMVNKEITLEPLGKVIGTVVGWYDLKNNVSMNNLVRMRTEALTVNNHQPDKPLPEGTATQGVMLQQTGETYDYLVAIEPFQLKTGNYLRLSFSNSPIDNLSDAFQMTAIYKSIVIVLVSLLFALLGAFWLKRKSEYFVLQLERLIKTKTLAGQSTSHIYEIDSINKSISTIVSDLVQSEYKTRTILNNSGALVYLKDINGKYEFANNSYLEVTRFSEEEVLGHTDIDLFGEEGSRLFRANDHKVLTENAVITFEENLVSDNTGKTFLSVKFPLHNQQGEVTSVCGFSTDISYMKAIEQDLIVKRNEAEKAKKTIESLNVNLESLVQVRTQELEATRDELIQAEKLAALGSLVAGVAHEINTPLGVCVTAHSHIEGIDARLRKAIEEKTVTKSQFETLLKDNTGSLDILGGSLKRLVKLVDSFKQISADQVGEKERTFEVNRVVEDMVNTLRPTMKTKQVQIDFIPASNVEITSYPGALTQVIANLVINAQIHGYARQGEGVVTVGVTNRAEAVEVYVSDQGQGISAEHLPKIFDPFFTTKLGQGSSGLGLHISYNLVTGTLQGQLSVKSKENQGTCFTITLPVNGQV